MKQTQIAVVSIGYHDCNDANSAGSYARVMQVLSAQN